MSEPFIPPAVQLLPKEAFERLIGVVGVRLLWLKSHVCPCTIGGPIAGSPDPECATCHGRGVFWDQPVGPWMGLITFMHMAPSPDEPGASAHTSFGNAIRGEPTLTIPEAAGAVWGDASIDDAYVEVDAMTRLAANLQVGGIQAIPYQHGLSVPASGAVRIYDQATHRSVSVDGYTVSNGVVSLPDSYPEGQTFTVEFYANPVYIAYRKAGATPHIRPFGQIELPRRFRLQPLDMWTRSRQGIGTSTSPQSVGA